MDGPIDNSDNGRIDGGIDNIDNMGIWRLIDEEK